MLDAVPFTNETRTSDWMIDKNRPAPRRFALKLVSDGVQTFNCFLRQAAIGEFLDAIGEPTFEKGRRDACGFIATAVARLIYPTERPPQLKRYPRYGQERIFPALIYSTICVTTVPQPS